MAMVDIVKEDVIEFAAELSTVTDGVWDRVLPYVNRHDLTETGEDEDTATLARLLLASHMASSMKPGAASSAAAGPVLSESVGGVRRAYANLAAFTTQSSLQSTKFGRDYQDLLRGSLANGPMLA